MAVPSRLRVSWCVCALLLSVTPAAAAEQNCTVPSSVHPTKMQRALELARGMISDFERLVELTQSSLQRASGQGDAAMASARRQAIERLGGHDCSNRQSAAMLRHYNAANRNHAEALALAKRADAAVTISANPARFVESLLQPAETLEPPEVQSLLERANEHIGTGAFAKAYPLATRATSMAPGNAEAWRLKGLTGYFTTLSDAASQDRPGGGFPEVISDLNKAAALAAPEDLPAVQFVRAWANFAAGRLEDAFQDAEDVVISDGSKTEVSTYFALLAHFAHERKPGSFGYWTDRCLEQCPSEWPAPITNYLAGTLPDSSAVKRGLVRRTTAEDLLRRASSADQRAEAEFYIGLDHYMTPGSRHLARPYFESVVRKGNPRLFEHVIAKAYLRRLEVE